MNSIESFLANLSPELRYYQIEAGDLLIRLRAEVSGSSTGIPPGFDGYNEMAIGMMQMSLDTFAYGKGVHLGVNRFSIGLAKKYMLSEDIEEITQDMASALNTRVLSVLPTTNIQHRFAYRLLYNCNVLIGLDPREFIHEPDCDSTAWEITSDFQETGF